MKDKFCSLNHVLTAIFCSVNQFWRGGFLHKFWENYFLDFLKSYLQCVTYHTWISVKNRTWSQNKVIGDTVPLTNQGTCYCLLNVLIRAAPICRVVPTHFTMVSNTYTMVPTIRHTYTALVPILCKMQWHPSYIYTRLIYYYVTAN